MVATLGLAVGQAERGRNWRRVGGSVVAGLGGKGKGRMQRHFMTICQIELSTVVGGCCRMS